MNTQKKQQTRTHLEASIDTPLLGIYQVPQKFGAVAIANNFSGTEWAVWSFLCMTDPFADYTAKQNKKFRALPSVEEISEAIGRSKRAVVDAMKMLEEIGFFSFRYEFREGFNETAAEAKRVLKAKKDGEAKPNQNSPVNKHSELGINIPESTKYSQPGINIPRSHLEVSDIKGSDSPQTISDSKQTKSNFPESSRFSDRSGCFGNGSPFGVEPAYTPGAELIEEVESGANASAESLSNLASPANATKQDILPYTEPDCNSSKAKNKSESEEWNLRQGQKDSAAAHVDSAQNDVPSRPSPEAAVTGDKKLNTQYTLTDLKNALRALPRAQGTLLIDFCAWLDEEKGQGDSLPPLTRICDLVARTDAQYIEEALASVKRHIESGASFDPLHGLVEQTILSYSQPDDDFDILPI